MNGDKVMNRLTEFHNGIWGMSVQAVKDGYDKYSVFSKLAEYENTGLTPEAVINLNNITRTQSNSIIKMGLRIEELDTDRDYWKAEAIKATAELGEMKIAEEQGLLIKLPCKVGDTVYYLDLNCMEIHEMRIQGMSINYNSLLILHLGDWVAVSVKDFGKSVFLTREAAEDALKKIN
jgi:hypothetical protein